MTVNLVVMPGSPALVRELSPGDDVGGRLLTAVRVLLDDAVTSHRRVHGAPPRIELVGSRDQRWYTARTGSFRAWGAPDVDVTAGNHLPELVQRYALGKWSDLVAETRDRLRELNREALTVVAVDGSAGLDARAPLACVPGADAADRWCRRMLAGEAGADRGSAAQLRERGVIEPGLWLELAGIRPDAAELVDADTSLGVGRYVAGWEV